MILFFFLALDVTFWVDDAADIFLDGSFFETYSRADTINYFEMDDDVSLMAFKATNTGGPKGIQIYLSDGRFSSGEIKCTGTEHSGTLRTQL